MNTITPGSKTGFWEVLSIDPTGKRCCAGCVCGNVSIISVASLLDGTAAPSCGCITTKHQAKTMRREAEERQRKREQTKWKPGDR